MKARVVVALSVTGTLLLFPRSQRLSELSNHIGRRKWMSTSVSGRVKVVYDVWKLLKQFPPSSGGACRYGLDDYEHSMRGYALSEHAGAGGSLSSAIVKCGCASTAM